MVTGDEDRKAIIHTLVVRFNHQRLPRALEIKSRVERGERLKNYDIEFLARVLEQSRIFRNLVVNHPEYHYMMAGVIGLYHEIIERGLLNERQSE